MTIGEALRAVRSVYVAVEAPLVVHTVGAELARLAQAQFATYSPGVPPQYEAGGLHVLAGCNEVPLSAGGEDRPAADRDGAYLKLDETGAGYIAATPLCLLYSFLTYLWQDLSATALATVQRGRLFPSSFKWNRSTYDFFLTQEGRVQYGFDRESHVRHLAEAGFTHVEVNGLAFAAGLESGPPDEAYPMFYTYCPALDQFVSSELNRGLYPSDYLAANLEYLKTNAALVRKYGLVPGLLCFEPRSVPERFFRRYPMLRGARVDHPFRSFKPRYNLTIAHPAVREHYAEMLQALMREVPELAFLVIWSNDSGAGFEHTQSLYVGRNGGPYLIREWKGEAEIARVAGDNVLRFLSKLRDAARKANPAFRVITRMESFYGEHDVIWGGLEDGLDVEAASLAMRGWDMPYRHPRYPDTMSMGAGTVYQQSFDHDESQTLLNLEDRGSDAHFYFAAGPNTVFAPLVGVPYPSLMCRRLKLLHAGGVKYLAQLGGWTPPELAPFDVNHEILRTFQFGPNMDVSAALERIASRWVGGDLAVTMQRAWELTEEAILAFPHVTPLYSTMGFVWYRLWARPLVPNVEAIPLADRAYYQNFMCTTPHNPNNVDLSRDVLFELATVGGCRKAMQRIDENVWQPIDRAIGLLEEVGDQARESLGQRNAIADLLIRLNALRCWFMTQRNVAAWIVGVCGYMEATTQTAKQRCRTIVDEMIRKELANSERLRTLCDSGVEFMATTDQEETALIHGRNLAQLLDRRMALMREHRHDEPFIDPNYIEKNARRRYELA
jgi:hypothetical protein